MSDAGAADCRPGRQLLRTLVGWDLAIVRRAGCKDRGNGRRIAIFVSRLGNGWIYLVILPLILLGLGTRGIAVIAVAAVNAALAHAVYPTIKRKVARPRPFDRDPGLVSLLDAKDVYSFPSGHTMTLAAVLWPIAHAAPDSRGGLVGMVAIMCWARVASAHHYPTDVLSGIVLGVAVGFPLSALCL